MKRCPTCNRSYADDTLAFCLQDGAQLVASYDPEATVIAQPPGSNSNAVYKVIILLLVLVLLAGAGITLFFVLNRNNQPAEAANVAQPSPEPSQGNPLSLLANQNANMKPLPSPAANNTLPSSGQPAIPKIYGKVYGAARKLLIQEGWAPNKRQAFHGQEADTQWQWSNLLETRLLGAGIMQRHRQRVLSLRIYRPNRPAARSGDRR